jgi:hypothetical protein
MFSPNSALISMLITQALWLIVIGFSQPNFLSTKYFHIQAMILRGIFGLSALPNFYLWLSVLIIANSTWNLPWYLTSGIVMIHSGIAACLSWLVIKQCDNIFFKEDGTSR